MIGTEILALRDQGLSYNEIVRQLGCSKGTVAYWCGAGQKEKNLKRQRDKRSSVRKYIQDIKTNATCTDCKEDYPYWILEFDHLEDKLFTISQAGPSSGLKALEREIKKCEIVCANCHRNRTHMRLVKSGSDMIDLSDKYGG